ncbi:MAG: Maf family nucleotide pyrophosphatase [Deltaproteobacteria bacterium]|nr:Maf family nucleotide pyrophosphatase [Deltaproteobacteria bacterium]
MFRKNEIIILASASPRRSELMELAGIKFSVAPSDINEEVLPYELPADHVTRLSKGKADAAAISTDGRFFVGADTVVVLDGTILGKPTGKTDASRMLRLLSGRQHEVITGFTVFDKINGIHISKNVSTEVTFKSLNSSEINAYIATGCPMDKAGAYAIQGRALHFVRSIKGSYTNVVGLPMTELYEVLQAMKALG